MNKKLSYSRLLGHFKETIGGTIDRVLIDPQTHEISHVLSSHPPEGVVLCWKINHPMTCPPHVETITATSIRDSDDCPPWARSLQNYRRVLKILSSSSGLGLWTRDLLLLSPDLAYRVPGGETTRWIGIIEDLNKVLAPQRALQEATREIERVEKTMLSTREEYWNALHSLLIKCSDEKIVRRGKEAMTGIDGHVLLFQARIALKAALDALRAWEKK